MEGKLVYGDHKCDNWNSINGIEDPLFKYWVQRIGEFTDGYEVMLYGGVLENWDTHDIDCTITGPYNPKHIRWMLDNIIRCTLECGLFPDIKYSRSGKLFKWSEWVGTGESVTIEYSYYRGSFNYNGALIEFAELNSSGLWNGTKKWPINKTLNKNHNYKDPIRLL